MFLVLYLYHQAHESGKQEGIKETKQVLIPLMQREVHKAHRERALLITKYLYTSCTQAKKFQLPIKGPDGKMIKFSCYEVKNI